MRVKKKSPVPAGTGRKNMAPSQVRLCAGEREGSHESTQPGANHCIGRQHKHSGQMRTDEVRERTDEAWDNISLSFTVKHNIMPALGWCVL